MQNSIGYVIAYGLNDGVHMRSGVTANVDEVVEEVKKEHPHLFTIGSTKLAIAVMSEAHPNDAAAQAWVDNIMTLPRKQKIGMAIEQEKKRGTSH